MSTSKVTTGANDRPKDETIAQTGPGLPDDSTRPVEVSEEEVERARAKLEHGTLFDPAKGDNRADG